MKVWWVWGPCRDERRDNVKVWWVWGPCRDERRDNEESDDQ